MRCLALAQMMREFGWACHFICKNLHGALTQRIQQDNFILKIIGEDLGIRADGDATIEYIKHHSGKNILIADNYVFDSRWMTIVSEGVDVLCVIDDLANREYSCDILVDSTPKRQRSDYDKWVSDSTKMLLGLDYAILRHEFLADHETLLEKRKANFSERKFKRVLISMGGTDPNNITAQVVDLLSHIPHAYSWQVIIVLSSNAANIDQYRHKSTTKSLNIETQIDVQDMANLYRSCDLAIGAAGISAVERCCMGLPSITIETAFNQRSNAIMLDAEGATVHLGTDNMVNIKTFKHALSKVRENYETFVTNGLNLCDGKGALRITQALIESVH